MKAKVEKEEGDVSDYSRNIWLRAAGSGANSVFGRWKERLTDCLILNKGKLQGLSGQNVRYWFSFKITVIH